MEHHIGERRISRKIGLAMKGLRISVPGVAKKETTFDLQE